MQETQTTAEVQRCDPADHDWKIVGKCVHGFGGQIMFEAATCAKCGQGGHRRTGGYACPRRAEKPAERTARIERQIAACPVWDALPEQWQQALGG